MGNMTKPSKELRLLKRENVSLRRIIRAVMIELETRVSAGGMRGDRASMQAADDLEELMKSLVDCDVKADDV